MQTYLITGGAGFIGSNFIKYMLKTYKEIKIINLDKLTYAGNINNLRTCETDERYSFVRGDICDKQVVENIFKQNNIDYVVNFAAESHVDNSIKSAFPFFETNVMGCLNLIEQARKFWSDGEGYLPNKKFLQISTDEVYGSLELDSVEKFNEQTNINPHSPYSASKASADMLVKSFYDTHKMPINITRCSNNYGPFQFPEKLIPLIFTKCLKKQSLPVYGDGLNVRDWLFVEDHCRAIDLVLHKGKIGEIYNIGGGVEQPNIAIVKKIINFLHKYDAKITEELITYVTDRKGHDRRYAIDCSKLTKELGYSPMYNFNQAMDETLTWYLNNKNWLENIVSGEYVNDNNA